MRCRTRSSGLLVGLCERTVSLLHASLQGANLRAVATHPARRGGTAARPPSPGAAGPPAPPPPTQSPPPLFSRFSFCVPAEALYCRPSSGTEPRDQKHSLHFCVFDMYYLCEKCYKHITLQHDLADCVSGVPRLTLLDLH